MNQSIWSVFVKKKLPVALTRKANLTTCLTGTLGGAFFGMIIAIQQPETGFIIGSIIGGGFFLTLLLNDAYIDAWLEYHLSLKKARSLDSSNESNRRKPNS